MHSFRNGTLSLTALPGSNPEHSLGGSGPQLEKNGARWTSVDLFDDIYNNSNLFHCKATLLLNPFTFSVLDSFAEAECSSDYWVLVVLSFPLSDSWRAPLSYHFVSGSNWQEPQCSGSACMSTTFLLPIFATPWCLDHHLYPHGLSYKIALVITILYPFYFLFYLLFVEAVWYSWCSLLIPWPDL